jgi:large subunit ribosomal protein L18
MEDSLMAKGASYRVQFRRRREGKTDYKARKALVMSRLPRVVTRPSLKHINVQVIEATPTGDKVVASANSQELRKYEWHAACGNIPSAYLTGLLCGVRAVDKGVKKAIADIGLQQPIKGSRIFASLKGFADTGVEVPHNVEKLPDEKRLVGQHIADYAKNMASSDTQLYEKVFSKYLKNSLSPEKIPEYFNTTKKNIMALLSNKKPRKRKRKVENQ